MSIRIALTLGAATPTLFAGLALVSGLAWADDDAPQAETPPPPKRMVLVELFTSQG